MKIRSLNLGVAFAVLWTGCASLSVSTAAPYASAVANTAGTVSFILNESADNVKIIHGTTTNDVGALAAGSHSFAVGAVNPVLVQVTKNAGIGWKTPAGSNFNHTVNGQSISVPWAGRLLISVSNNLLTRYPAPRGLAVNRNPASPAFGRVYVANSTPGTTAGRAVGRGLYVMNADLSDSPAGYGDTARFTTFFDSANQFSPYQISVGSDDYLYIADFSDAAGSLRRADPDLADIELVLDYVGGPSLVPSPNNHGSTKRIRTTGSLAGGDLKVYSLDEDYIGDPNAPIGTKPSIWRYDIDAGPLTNQTQSTAFITPTPSWLATGTQDFTIGTNGLIYAIQNRSGGAEPGLYVVDLNGTTLYSSRTNWQAIQGGVATNDVFVNLQSVAVSPDCKYLAINLLASGNPSGSDCWIIPLQADGLPNLTNRMVLDSGAVTQGRGVDFDAAGNLYTISSGDAQLRVWSPGGSTTITSGTDGTFDITTPPSTVSVAATVAVGNEAGPVNPVFTVTRVGGADAAMTVNYTLGGTATAGTDYSALPGSVTFQPGATTTNITITVLPDLVSELTETVVLTIAPGVGYGLGSPATANATILDANTPEISIAPGGGGIADGARTNILESFADSTAVYTLTRRGLLSTPTTVTLSYSGAAGHGVDFNGPTTITFAANAVTTNVVLASINDNLVEAPEAFTVTVVAGGGYQLGTPVAGSGLVYSEDLAPGTLVFGDNFDSDTSVNWFVNQSFDLDSEAIFGYDYSVVGIPEAPGSTGSFTSTSGLRLRAHVGLTALTPGISVSPVNLNVSGDHRLSFDAWVNYNGPLDVGGAGSSQHISYGLGTGGNTAIWPGSGFSDCVWFTTSSDGDVGEASTTQADYGVFVGTALQPAATGYYAAGIQTTNRGGSDPHYAAFGGSVATAAQLASYPAQTSTVRRGAIGMAWHRVVLTREGDFVTWDINGYRIASVNLVEAGIPLQNNIFLGFHDWFSSVNGNPDITFALYDNVKVETVAAPIIITSIQLVSGGTEVLVSFNAAASAVPGDFELHKASTVIGPYSNDAGAEITGSNGSYQAKTAVSGPQQFYLIKKP